MKKRIFSLLLTTVIMASLMTTMVSAQTFSLSRSNIMTASDLPTYTIVNEFAGKMNIMKFTNTNASTTKVIRYQNLNMDSAYSSSNRYLLVDCYLDQVGSTTPYGLSVTFRKVKAEKWISSEPTSTRSSDISALPNKWVTIAIDCIDPLNYLVTNKYILDQLQIEIPGTSGNLYVGDVRFAESTGNFAFDRSSIMTANDLPTYTLVNDFAGKTDVMKFTNINASTAKVIRYQNFNMDSAYSNSNRYLLVDCYLEQAGLTTPYGLSVTFRRVKAEKWISSEPTSTRSSDILALPNKWVTIAIDCIDPLNYLVANKYILDQLQIEIPNTTGNFYVGDVRFSSVEKEIKYVFEDANGKYVYLSEDATVTVNSETVAAFATVTEAFTALGTEGGTVYLEGTLNAFADVGKGVRGDVLLRGLGDTEEDIKRNIINGIDIEVKGGNITFDYLTVNPGTMGESEAKYASFYSCQRDYTDMGITIGAHVESAGIAIGNKKPYENGTVYWANADKVTINGGNFYSVTPTSNYGSRFITRLGTIDYTINGGNFNALYAGSNNSWEWENSEIRGDVKYTINGGNFTNHMVMGSAYGATNIQGNIIWTINGGVMGNRRIVGGNKNDAQKSDRQKNLNNVAAVVNLKGEKTGLSGLTLGTDGVKGKHINENEIYILNNYEDNTGTKIADGSLAEYKMHVYYGKAEPVFANDQTAEVNGATQHFGGSLVGFTLTPDEIGSVPYVNGKAVEPDLNGRYQIGADTGNIIEVVFVRGNSSKIISFTASDTTVSVKAYNYSDDVLSAIMYIAEYDERDSLENVIVYPINIETSAEVQTLTKDFSMKDGGIYRAFLWDSTSIMPLAKALDLK